MLIIGYHTFRQMRQKLNVFLASNLQHSPSYVLSFSSSLSFSFSLPPLLYVLLFFSVFFILPLSDASHCRHVTTRHIGCKRIDIYRLLYTRQPNRITEHINAYGLDYKVD